jgi:hypothetical protein
MSNKHHFCVSMLALSVSLVSCSNESSSVPAKKSLLKMQQELAIHGSLAMKLAKQFANVNAVDINTRRKL